MRSKEPRGQRDDPAGGFGCGLAEHPEKDVLDPPDVDELEGQGRDARLIEACGTVLPSEAQEFLGLAELAPGKVPAEQAFGEAPDGLAELAGFSDHVVRIASGVGLERFRVVVVVGGASSGSLDRVGLDELALEVDAHQGSIPAHEDFLAPERSRHRVESLAELDVVIRVDAALGPMGRVEPRFLQRQKGGLLLLFEDDQGRLVGGAVIPRAGGLQAPTDRLALHVFGVQPVLTAEEVFPYVGDLPLDVGLSLRVVGGGRIDDEAPMPGVLGEGPLEVGLVAIGLGDSALQIVHDAASRDPAEELPGVLQAVDHLIQLLGPGDMNVHVPAVDQDHDQRPEQAAPPGLGIEHIAESTEVDLTNFSWSGRRAANRDDVLAELAVLDREAMQRTIGDLDPLALEQAANLGQRQAPPAVRLRKPSLDLRLAREQQTLARTRLGGLRPRANLLQDLKDQSLLRLFRAYGPARLLRQMLIAPDRLAAQTRRRRHHHLTLAPAEAAKNLLDLPHTVLPKNHLHLLGWR